MSDYKYIDDEQVSKEGGMAAYANKLSFKLIQKTADAETLVDSRNKLKDRSRQLETELATANERIKSLESCVEWQPMETAPKVDGHVLMWLQDYHGPKVCHYLPGGHCIEDHPPIAEGWYYNTGSQNRLVCNGLGWMHIPRRPSPEAVTGGGE